jgi:hypothetical protein
MTPRKPTSEAPSPSPSPSPSSAGGHAGPEGHQRGAPSLLFVDAIEGEKARLLWGVEAFDVPLGLLPAGTGEGAWLHLTLSAAPAPPDEGGALRDKLSRDDDGGDIKL